MRLNKIDLPQRLRRFGTIGLVMGLLVATVPSVAAQATPTESLYSELDLSRPELSGVAAAVASNNYSAAAAALQQHYANRVAPVFSQVTPGSASPLVASTPDELIAGLFRFPDGQQRDFSAGIDWSHTWSTEPGVLGSPHYLIYDFAFYPTLTGDYLSLEPSDPRRAQLAAAWMRTAKDFMATHDNRIDAYNRLGEAKRLTQWLTAYSVFKSDPSISAADNAAYVHFIHRMTDDLWKTIESYNGNNWYISIGRAIYLSAIYFPEFAKSAAWEMRAVGVANRFIAKHIKGDGNEYEPAFNYQAYSLSLLLQIEEFGRLNGRSPLADSLALLERQAEAIMDATMPNFTVPLVGDTQSGSVSISSFAELFDRDDMRWVASGGLQGLPPRNGSTLYPHSFAIMRSGWNNDSSYLLVNNQDTDYGASHRHPDDLSVVAFAYGRPLLVDPGVVDYNNNAVSNWLRRTTEAHNTVEVNGAPQPAVGVLPRVRSNTEWLTNDAFDFYTGMHDDYAPITHERSVFFAKPGMWIVSDRLTGASGENDYRQLWHAPADADVVLTQDGVVNAGFGAVPGIAIVPVGDVAEPLIHNDGYVSDGQGNLATDAAYVSFDQTVTGAASFDTVLVPGPAGAPVSVSASRIPLAVPEAVASAMTIVLDDSEVVYYLNSDTNAAARQVGAYQAEGGLFYAERSDAGVLRQLSVADLKSVSHAGTALVQSNQPIRDLSVIFGDQLELAASSPFIDAVRINAPDVDEVLLNGEPVAFSRDGDTVVIEASTFTATGPALFEPSVDPQSLASTEWAFAGGGEEKWTTVRGEWVPAQLPSGLWGYRQGAISAVEGAAIANGGYSDVDFSADFTLDGASGTYGAGLYLRYQDATNYYLLRLYRTGGQTTAQVVRVLGGQSTVLETVPITVDVSGVVGLRGVARAEHLSLWLNGTEVVSATDSSLASGAVGLYAHRLQGIFSDVAAVSSTQQTWDFSAGDTASWTSNNGSWGAFEKAPGEWGFKQSASTVRDSTAYILGTPNDATLAANFTLTGAQASMAFGLNMRYQDALNSYILRIYKTGGAYSAQIVRMLGGVSTLLATASVAPSFATSLELRGVTEGSRIELWLGDDLLVAAEDTALSTGGIGLYTDRASGIFESVGVSSEVSSETWDFSAADLDAWWMVKGDWTGAAGDLEGGRLRQQDAAGSDSAAVVVNAPRDVELSGEFMLESGANTFGAGMYLRYHDSGNLYLVRLYKSGGVQSAQLVLLLAGRSTVLATAPVTIDTAQQVSMRAVASGDRIEMWLNGARVVSATDKTLPSGGVGLYTHKAAGSFQGLRMSQLVAPAQWRTSNGVAETIDGATLVRGDGGPGALVRSTDGLSWTDYSLQATVTPQAWVADGTIGLVVRTSGDTMGYRLLVQEKAGVQTARIERVVAGSRGTLAPVLLAEAPVAVNKVGTIELEAIARGDVLEFVVDGQKVLTVRDGVIARGGVALYASGVNAAFESVAAYAPDASLVPGD